MQKRRLMLSHISYRQKNVQKLIAGVSATALMFFGIAPLPQIAVQGARAASVTSQPVPENIATETPIKHIIYIIGENRSFDNIYATYQPKNGQQIWNLLSRGIINVDGTQGNNFAKGQQFQATSSNGLFFLSPQSKVALTFLPVPTILDAQAKGVGLEFGIVNAAGTPTATFPQGDTEIPLADQIQLATGGTGTILENGTDTRIVGVNNLPAGPFPQTGPELPYDSYEGDTIHQLFQMWQQNDCSMRNATVENPTGCLHDLYPYVATTYGTLPNQTSTDGGQDMAFYNVSKGDAPIFKALADKFTISDNFHQSIYGGSVTGAIAIAFGDNAFYSDGNGNPLIPPGSIMNPNPVPGTFNTYQSVGTWVNCSDPTQPGVVEITQYLASLPYFVGPNCQANAYYMTRDASQAYNANGTLAPASATTLPPLTQRHIGDVMNAQNIPWAYYGGGYNSAVAVANGAKDLFDLVENAGYCIECNPFQYSKSIMADPAQTAAHLRDVVGNGTVNGLFDDIAKGTLPSVAFVKPDGALEGHPGSGKVDLLEDFIQNIVTLLQANPKLYADTAIIVSFDESGGLYDSGFIQPLDFFGDGPRMPMLVISPYSTGGRVVHSYNDQASVLKFIERNWHLGKISNRSRDNLPNPIMSPINPWVPVNMPAIGDLFDMFDFTLGSLIQNDVNQEIQAVDRQINNEINSVLGK
jgi:phospholipase C